MVHKINGVNTLCIRIAVNIFHTLEDFRVLAKAVGDMRGNYSKATLQPALMLGVLSVFRAFFAHSPLIMYS